MALCSVTDFGISGVELLACISAVFLIRPTRGNTEFLADRRIAASIFLYRTVYNEQTHNAKSNCYRNVLCCYCFQIISAHNSSPQHLLCTRILSR
jgi:hypothetical protein